MPLLRFGKVVPAWYVQAEGSTPCPEQWEESLPFLRILLAVSLFYFPKHGTYFMATLKDFLVKIPADEVKEVCIDMKESLRKLAEVL